jgi:putative colanic acid biosynthesis glycosyltransferase
MAGPLISIIIPAFNAASTIRKSLSSVADQILIEKEIIVVDGGSTDETIDIISSFRSSLAYFIHEKDEGVYDAINKGLNLAKGEWIYILGADDYLDSTDTLSKLFSAHKGKVSLIFGKAINESGQNALVPKEHVSSMSFGLIFRNTLHQQSVLYHRSIFDNFRFTTQYKVLADYDLHLKLYRESVEYISTTIIVAHCKAQGLSKRFNWSLYKEELAIKKNRLQTIYWLINIPWVLMKFIIKNLF